MGPPEHVVGEQFLKLVDLDAKTIGAKLPLNIEFRRAAPRSLMITPVGKLGAIRLHKQDIHLPEGEVMLPVQEIVHVHAAESTARDVLTHLMK